MGDQYYIRSRGRVQGPYTASRLKELATRGHFSRYHHVSSDRENWERASTHPELFPDAGPPKVRSSPPPGDLYLSEPTDPAVEDEPDSEEMDDGKAGESEWFYTSQGTEQSEPISFAQLQLLASTGQLAYDDSVWTNGMPNWTLAPTVPELFPEDNAAPIDTQQDVIRVDVNTSDGPQATAPMAVASFVLGLLGISLFFFIGSILAIVFGHIALKQIGHSKNRLGGHGLAITGLILGYLVLVFSIIVGIFIICFSLLAVATHVT